MTDNDIAMIAEIRTWNRENGIPVKMLLEALEEVYGIDRSVIAHTFYQRLKRGKYKTRGRPRCTLTDTTNHNNT